MNFKDISMTDFVELKNYPGYWIAHSPPRLRNANNTIIRECSQTPNSKQDNYWIVTVRNTAGKLVKCSMHRLLMQTFIPNPKNKAHVNHVDGNKANNSMDNLEWATPKENAQHAIRIGLKNHDWAKKEVHQYNLNGDYITSYTEDIAAQTATGIPKQNISKATLGKREHAGFFQWSRNKVNKMPATEKFYIKSYTVGGITYMTLKKLAEAYSLANPHKQNFSRVARLLSDTYIAINYYD